MNNILVCVTKQKECERLIDYGKNMCREQGGSLHVIHVAGLDYVFLSNSEDGRALEYLHAKAEEAGSALKIIKSDDVLETLADEVIEQNITDVIVGVTHESDGYDGFLDRLKEEVKDHAVLRIIPVNISK